MIKLMIKQTLDRWNLFVKSYSNAATIVQKGRATELKLRLIKNRQRDGQTYNLPFATVVAALIVGDIDMSFDVRDIIVEH